MALDNSKDENNKSQVSKGEEVDDARSGRDEGDVHEALVHMQE